MITLGSRVSEISPIAKKISSRLKKLGIEIVSDLLFYYPFRYDDFSQMKDIENLNSGDILTVCGRVDLIGSKRSHIKKSNITEAIISDDTGSMKVVWFNQPFIIKNVKQGDNLYLSGKVDVDYNVIQMVGPEYERVGGKTANTGRLVPVYSLTHGITNKQLRFLIKISLPLIDNIKDWVPGQSIEKLDLTDIKTALNQIHFPDSSGSLRAARIRLKFNELFLIQIQKQVVRNKMIKMNAISVEFKEDIVRKFVSGLPFKLTGDQKKASWSILKDIQKKYPMNRLVEGDVGSGKTIVAAIAMLNTANCDYQSAYMAPTEILAKQHFESMAKFYDKFDITIGLLTRTDQKITNKNGDVVDVKKKEFLKMIESGGIDVVIGTHAIIQSAVRFNNLALSIVDEQHRFGVEQRRILKEKSGDSSTSPHFLSMTATPIPRTLHLAFNGDLDLSIIKEMPIGRKNIITKIVEHSERDDTYELARKQIGEGRQVLVICPLIDESDKLGVRSVNDEYEKLSKIVFPDIKIGVLHGRLKSDEKSDIMNSFLKNDIKILIATSVIEVGVDIPNATVMLIEGADRFGLAQLHQFRGRIGRGKHQSHCFLLSDSLNDNTKNRLEVLVDSSDGFELAKRDMEFRGFGDIYGKSQSGIPELKIATLLDYGIIENANNEARKIIEIDSTLNKFPELKEKMDIFEKSIHLE